MADGKYFSTTSAKKRIGHLLTGFWSTTRRTYAGHSDRTLYFPTWDELQKILRENIVPKNTVDLGEGFDCDDYAFVLKGKVSLYGRSEMKLEHSMCLGIAWARFRWVEDEYHAANWAMDDTGKFFWIEPQEQNKIYQPFQNQIAGGLTTILV